MQQARPVGVAFAATPGATATTLVDLEAGSYLLICSLPVAEGGERARHRRSRPPTRTPITAWSPPSRSPDHQPQTP